MAAIPSILTHSSDADPGLSRRKRGKGFSYHAMDGARVADPKVLERVKDLGIPPAWTDVWICAQAHGHLQATGFDDRGRKQYRYHPEWRAFRDRQKYAALAQFGEALPALRARVRRDLGRNQPDQRFVCAALVRLIDRTSLRVGNDEYARENGTYGATTLRMKHISLDDSELRLGFTAKGGKRVRKQVSDTTLHRALERIGDLPGRELFHYIDEAGERRGVDSSDVNAYIAETLDGEISAKTFRTWRGSVEAFAECRDLHASGQAPTLKALSERAAESLHNTPAICRSSYIHPAVIDLVDSSSERRGKALLRVRGTRRAGLRADEAEFLALL